ncbi:Pimeloyl-(acyl-carrier protein) methyl ester esterase [Shimia sp. SK013]|uniref:alpha/beta fold hydrolase n=1 Tax=Shimia sp. SK013 TaxID=1389006 RepID=UPI0006B44979|nr:alpha/beta hydrolase [Shimia sp. SK013]KPA20970.1 Pimeloyl-(acyl-carrier protein) methyl ester esterase [Shimia sp. SK013]
MSLDFDGKTYWRRLGEGARPALALHCNLGHSGAFRGIGAELGDLLTIQAPDMPGHGRSDAYQAGTLAGQFMLDAILEKLDGPVDVIGHSYGGLLGLRLAIERPEMVRSLSLFEPVTMLAAKDRAPEEVAKNDAHMSKVIALYEAGDPEGAVRMFVEEWGDGTPWEQLNAETRATFARQVPVVVASQKDVLEDIGQVMPRLGQVAVPCVVMDGALSPPIMKPACDGLAAMVKNGRRATIAGAGHMGAITHARAVAAEVRQTIGAAA